MNKELPECCNECYAYGTLDCDEDECNKLYRTKFEEMLQVTDEHYSDSDLKRCLKMEENLA